MLLATRLTLVATATRSAHVYGGAAPKISWQWRGSCHACGDIFCGPHCVSGVQDGKGRRALGIEQGLITMSGLPGRAL